MGTAMLAPEPHLTACLHVLYLAAVHGRLLGYAASGSLLRRIRRTDAEQYADLMDAVHNIPLLLPNWEKCKLELLLGMLSDYDKKWGYRCGYRLRDAYESKLRGED